MHKILTLLFSLLVLNGSWAGCNLPESALQFVDIDMPVGDCRTNIYHGNGQQAYYRNSGNWYHLNGQQAYFPTSGNWY